MKRGIYTLASWLVFAMSGVLIVWQTIAFIAGNIPGHILPLVRHFSGTQEAVPVAYACTFWLGLLSLAAFVAAGFSLIWIHGIRRLFAAIILKRKIAVAAICLTIIAAGAWFYSNSLLRSEGALRLALFKRTPPGSSSVDVRSFVEREGWLDRSYDGTRGFLKQEPGMPAQEVGVTSVRGRLGHYFFPLRTDVTAFWAFDADGRLIDIWVWKTVDGL